MKLKTIILAAGQGTRMRSSRPKVLHRLAGISLLEHVCQLADAVGGDATTVVYGHGADQLLTQLDHLNVTWTEQAEQLGTGHAVMQTVDQIDDDDTVLILYGDVPLLRQPTVERLLQLVEKQTLALLTVVLDNPAGYGRIVRSAAGSVEKIVEQKDTSAEQQAIDEVNTGILALNGGHLKKWLAKLENSNAQGEYYLTDIIAMAVADGVAVNCTQPEDPNEVLGVNDRHQLACLERCYQLRQAEQLMDQGVTLIDPARFDLRGLVTDVGQDVEIDINVILEGEVSLGDRVRIGANTIIKNSSIAADSEILPNSIIEDAVVGAGCRIGPYARLRPETRLDNDVHIGNFVELKKSIVAAGSKINHLSYIGDCSVGSGVNIGAGTITCNYDGVNKFQTTIRDDAFIGSNSQLVAPVTIGRGATIGAGSTITRNTPDEQLTLTRGKQQSIEGWKRPVKQKE